MWPEADFVVSRVKVVPIRGKGGVFVSGEFTVALEPPADLGLELETSGLGTFVDKMLGGQDVQIGEPEFDDAFAVKSTEPARARALFHPALRRHLLEWKDFKLHVTDESVVFKIRLAMYTTYTLEELARYAPPVEKLARAIEASLGAVPPSILFNHLYEPWRRCAEANGLGFAASPLRMWGTLHGAPTAARAVVIEGGTFATEVRLRFAEPPRDARAVASVRAFGVPDGELEVTDSGLTLRIPGIADPTALERTMDRLKTLARELHEHAGPYR